MNGVPPGPLYGQLKAGIDIVLEDGKVISAADAVGPPTPGRKIGEMVGKSDNKYINSQDCLMFILSVLVLGTSCINLLSQRFTN